MSFFEIAVGIAVYAAISFNAVQIIVKCENRIASTNDAWMGSKE